MVRIVRYWLQSAFIGQLSPGLPAGMLPVIHV
jgi:hypothetical protein